MADRQQDSVLTEFSTEVERQFRIFSKNQERLCEIVIRRGLRRIVRALEEKDALIAARDDEIETYRFAIKELQRENEELRRLA